MNVLKVLVGSRLHGLSNESSDYDWRGIFKEPLIDVLSPFKKQKSISWIEGKEDDTSYELIHFCKLAANSNPTVLEVLWSHLIEEKNEIGSMLIENRTKFLDTEKLCLSHLGYAENQIKKMDMYNPNERTPKTIIAYVRVLRQGIELLKTMNFDPVYKYEDRDLLMEMKYNFSVDLIPHATELMIKARKEFNKAKESAISTSVDIQWIENFLLDVYTNYRPK